MPYFRQAWHVREGNHNPRLDSPHAGDRRVRELHDLEDAATRSRSDKGALRYRGLRARAMRGEFGPNRPKPKPPPQTATPQANDFINRRIAAKRKWADKSTAARAGGDQYGSQLYDSLSTMSMHGKGPDFVPLLGATSKRTAAPAKRSRKKAAPKKRTAPKRRKPAKHRTAAKRRSRKAARIA